MRINRNGTLLRMAAALAACSGLLASACAGGADAELSPTTTRAPLTDHEVGDLAAFEAALEAAKPGDVILLAPGTYPELTIEARVGITIGGTRDARVDGMRVLGADGIVITGITLTPSGDEHAEILVGEGSRDITIENVLVDGLDEQAGANIAADETVSGLTIRDSEITNCGRGNRCIAMSGTQDVLVVGNEFHDCISCDFIRGGSGMTIRRNTFDRAVRGTCEEEGAACPHNDHVQILGGGPWLIQNNRFGDREGGAATIYVSPGRDNEGNPVRDLRIVSNLFVGVAGRYGIEITGGDQIAGRLIRNVSIINNTILSGRVASLTIGEGWSSLPLADRPLVANNIFGRVRNNSICSRARLAANVGELGHTRCPGLVKADPMLGADGAPTSTSSVLVNKADLRYAPRRDHFGLWRNGPPDIGAIELGGRETKG
jgi:hypothetical protein